MRLFWLCILLCLLFAGNVNAQTKTDRQRVLDAIAAVAQTQPTTSGRTNRSNILTRLKTLLTQVAPDPVCDCAPEPQPAPEPEPEPEPTPEPEPQPEPEPVPQPQPTPANLLFSNGWERAAPAVGCNPNTILDAGSWSDAGGSTMCPTNEAAVEADVAFEGSRSLRVTQYPGRVNGTDVRVEKQLGNQTSATFVWAVRYDSNYVWSSRDHKVLITIGGSSQNVYVNFRGQQRLCAAPASNDTVFCGFAPIVTGKWFQIKLYVVAGNTGSVELWVKPQGEPALKVNLVHEAGPGSTNPMRVNTGSITAFKLDTTFNDSGAIRAAMNMRYDDVRVYRGLYEGW